eukprot:8077085-Ditylum_brightwellii.AAC.1
MEDRAIDSTLSTSEVGYYEDEWLASTTSFNMRMMEISDLAANLFARADVGQMVMAAGAARATENRYIYSDVDGDNGAAVLALNETMEDESEEDFSALLGGDLDILFISVAHANKVKNILPDKLAKVWQITEEEAERTLEVTLQHTPWTKNKSLSKNYSLSDRALRHQRIKEKFFMDTFFATKKDDKASRKEVLQAVKQFTKEIGIPNAIIAGVPKEQMSLDLRWFCNSIGSTLRVLEESTPWANRTKLYIVFIKEAVRKDMKDGNSPLPFWDYCVERK